MLAQKRNETIWEFWISFWPTAPLFGVEWRFAGMMPATSFFDPAGVSGAMARAAEAEAAKPAPKPTPKPAKPAKAETAAPKPVIVEATVVEPPAPEPTAPAGPARPATLFDKAPAEVDDLKQIKGIGPKLEAMLNDLGVYRLDQIAAFSTGDVEWIDDNLTTFKGRAFRDDWIAQAKSLL